MATEVLVGNLEHWFERLLEQLHDLDECRCEVTGDEFELMKEQTVQQIKKFNQSLDRMQHGDSADKPRLSELKVSLRRLINSSFDTKELVKYFGTQGATDLGLQLMELEEDFKLKKVDSVVYYEQKRRILSELQHNGGKLSKEEKAFLAD